MQDVAATKLRGELGLLGALHTWSRQLVYHPHIHYIVPGVALRKDGILVTPKDPDYLLCVKVLSVRMRTRFERALRERAPALFHQIQPSVWRKAWVVHSEPVGCGEHALKYLSRYIYRTAISTERHLEESNGSVSFRYKDSKTREQKTAVLPVLVFLAMFLQHVLPKRFADGRGPATARIIILAHRNPTFSANPKPGRHAMAWRQQNLRKTGLRSPAMIPSACRRHRKANH
jgi:hypothetical protein